MPIALRVHLPALLFVSAVSLLPSGCKPRHETKPEATPAAAVTAPLPTPAATLGGEKIRGRWVRSDGGYVLAIGDIDANGRAQASYFNPSPINVAWSRVVAEPAGLTLMAELRDANYPGCLYKLTYDTAHDRLVGTYFQAQLQETYSVEFQRER